MQLINLELIREIALELESSAERRCGDIPYEGFNSRLVVDASAAMKDAGLIHCDFWDASVDSVINGLTKKGADFLADVREIDCDHVDNESQSLTLAEWGVEFPQNDDSELQCYPIASFWFRSPSDSRWNDIPDGVDLRGYVCAYSHQDAISLIEEYCPGVEIDEFQIMLWENAWPEDSPVSSVRERSLWIEFPEFVKKNGQVFKEYQDPPQRVL